MSLDKWIENCEVGKNWVTRMSRERTEEEKTSNLGEKWKWVFDNDRIWRRANIRENWEAQSLN